MKAPRQMPWEIVAMYEPDAKALSQNVLCASSALKRREFGRLRSSPILRQLTRSPLGAPRPSSATMGACRKYHIVGEDEADPKAGYISFVSPVASFLMGKAVGEA